MENIYWGDIHNHCSISYGFGSLENALNCARNHLDFVAITGHAMWPDMYERTPETAFLVDFHNEGFRKLRANWQETKRTIALANTGGLVTFQAYEMHSSTYGDHHIVSPDDVLPLIDCDSPKTLLQGVGCPAFTVAHHIGYTPGYRGINWDLFDERITPLVEVCSKHGCAMSETAPFPYYHDMGPRDSHNTVYEGLLRGNHFGFVGSTDHHAGFPGSYGDGKLAVLAQSKSRKSLYAAMLARHTYAVTGDRILCDFTVDDAPMGSILQTTSHTRRINFRVKACYSLNKLVIFKNLKPLHIVDGLTLLARDTDHRWKLRVEMGWGSNSEDLFAWHGSICVLNGKLESVEPCFCGRSVLSPTQMPKIDDEINAIDSRLLSFSNQQVEWQCFTLKNPSTLHPQTNAIIIELSGDTPSIEININNHKRISSIKELMHYGYTEHMQPYHSNAFKVHPAISESQYLVSSVLTDKPTSDHDFYHMEVYQANGSCAFVSPVYFQ